MSQETKNISRSIKSFTGLTAWQEGHTLVLRVYKLTKNFPRDEMFGLVSQMKRAAVSVTSNLAEGFTRHSLKEKLQFYAMAHASLSELQNQLLIARDVEYISKKDFQECAEQSVKVHMLVGGLIRATRERSRAS